MADALAAASKLEDPTARQGAYEAALAECVQAGDVGRLTGFAEHGERMKEQAFVSQRCAQR
jgi:hypothetical protein